MEDGQGARRGRAVTPKRQGAKASGSATRQREKVARVTLHLGESVAKRLAVHSALAGRNQSALATEILGSWLARFGKGRECFDSGASPDQVGLAVEGIGEADPG